MISARCRGWRLPLVLAASVALSSANVRAQGTDAQPIAPSVALAITRARGLVERGDVAGSRALLDSLVDIQPTGSNEFAEALYWRATLSDRALEAERDWKRLTIEAPLSARMPDALLWLGEFETVRSRYVDARRHLERLLRDYSDIPQRPTAMLWMARGYFDERDVVRACETVTSLHAAGVPEGELKLQADEMGRRCRVAQSAGMNAARDSAMTADSLRNAAPPSAPRASTPKAAASRRQFSVQFAAYDTRAEATRMVKRLASRGITARIDGDRKPFRVRTGRYPSEADAKTALAAYRKKGLTGIIAEVTR